MRESKTREHGKAKALSPVDALCAFLVPAFPASLLLQTLKNSLEHLDLCAELGEVNSVRFLGWTGEGIIFDAKRMVIFA